MSKRYQLICADPPWGNFKDTLQMSDVKRGASSNYSTMSIAEIESLPVKDIADPSGAVLALWVPSSILADGLSVMQAWGFQQKQTYVWNKTRKEPLIELQKSFMKLVRKFLKDGDGFCPFDALQFSDIRDVFTKATSPFSLIDTLSFGMGRLFRNTHEICLIGTNNNGIYKKLANRSQRSVCFAENIGHSSKPEILQDQLELMFPDKNTKKIELFARRQRKGWCCLGNEVCNGEDIRVSLSKLI